MNRNEKIQKLEAWLRDNDPLITETLTRHGKGDSWPERSESYKEFFRQHEAVVHELQRQEDKKVIEELGLFDE